MPLIVVLGVPRMTRWRRRRFKKAMMEAVANIPDMNLTPYKISVLTFREAGGFDGEIHAQITFNENEKRDENVRKELAKTVAEVIEKSFPKLRWWIPLFRLFSRESLIEVWGNPFPSTNGFFFIRHKREY